MDLATLTLSEIEQGWHTTATAYICNYCGQDFQQDQVFQLHDAFYPAAEMVNRHIQSAHPDAITQLIQSSSKYNTLTNKQRDLLVAFSQGVKDATIAQDNHVAAATIRHQKFTFREKAKQAKLYLAIYNQVFNNPERDTPIALPPATQANDPIAITQRDYHQLLQKYFEPGDQLRLKRWPKQQKAILAILKRVSLEIPTTQHFTEHAINDRLVPIFDDYVRLRRYLIDYGFLARTPDGQDYWRLTFKE